MPQTGRLGSQRQFKAYAPRKALLTDITYLFYRGGVCYLSPIPDVCTHEILAYRLSDSLRVDFVLDMVDDMCARYGVELDNTAIVHSDQGCIGDCSFLGGYVE